VEKKTNSRSSLCASAVTVSSTTKQSPSVGWDVRVCGPGDPWESNAMCDLQGRNPAVMLVGSSIFTVFVGGDPELWKQEGLARHKQCKQA